MAYITKEQVEEFCGKYAEDGATMPDIYTEASMEAVANYLGYEPEAADYTETVTGDGTGTLAVKAPVLGLTTINGETPGDAYTVKNYVKSMAGVFKMGKRYTVAYRGGFETVPSKIVICALQIASLFWESAGGNLAVSSTSFADTGSRVFNNFKIDRFLESINEYRCYNA